jgi:solute carrier family 25 carnitine/acylcarnitine transporter 20/29
MTVSQTSNSTLVCIPMTSSLRTLVQMQVMNSAAPSTSSSAVGGRSSGRAIRKYNGTIDCVIQTIKNEGLFRGLYRGQTALLLREIPGNFMWYGVYEGVCKYRIPQGGSKRDLGVETHLLGGASAGVAYWTAFYPADTVGSQMRANPEYASKNFVEVFRNVYRREGWMGLYRGWGITVVRAAPTHALIFAMYEQTMALFRRFDSDSVDYIDTRSGSISH